MTDDLMRRFNSGMAERIMNNPSMPDDVALESKMVSKAIESAQAQVEGVNAEQRKNVLKYDDVMNRQREAIYTDRRRILEGDDIHEKVEHFLEDVVKAMVVEATQSGNPDDWDLRQLWTNFKQLYPISLTVDEVAEEAGGVSHLTPAFIEQEVLSDARLQYQAREEAVGSQTMRELERRVVLSTIGRKWQEHLYEMDYLKEGIGLRAMAQRDPLVEYQREGYAMFQTMMEGIREDSIGTLFHLELPAGRRNRRRSARRWALRRNRRTCSSPDRMRTGRPAPPASRPSPPSPRPLLGLGPESPRRTRSAADLEHFQFRHLPASVPGLDSKSHGTDAVLKGQNRSAFIGPGLGLLHPDGAHTAVGGSRLRGGGEIAGLDEHLPFNLFNTAWLHREIELADAAVPGKHLEDGTGHGVAQLDRGHSAGTRCRSPVEDPVHGFGNGLRALMARRMWQRRALQAHRQVSSGSLQPAHRGDAGVKGGGGHGDDLSR
nr:hypothetical protein [Arthrobacter sp. JCM 19049]